MPLNRAALPVPAEAPAVAMRGVGVSYGAASILRGIDIDLARGEVLAVLGRNGVGKTSLIEALFNLGPTIAGRIALDGQDVTGWPTHRIARLGIGLVPQGRGVFPNLTVSEALRMAALRPRRTPGVAPWTLERVFETFPRLAERRGSLHGSLSGGERQLLAVARALMTGAHILVLDEPSEGLAPLAVEEVIVGTVGRLAREGMTILIAEQNVGMTLRLADRAVVLSNGTVAYDGAAAALAADKALLHEHLGVRGS